MHILNTEVYCMFSYDPLWETMRKKKITQYQLIKDYGISTGILDSLRKNRSITMHTLDNLCQILNCTPNEIIRVEKES